MALGGIGLALSAISTVAGVVGSIQQANAASAQAEYQAGVARNNQIIADQNARYSVAAGEAQAQAQDLKNRSIGGAIEAAQGASGLALDSPTLRDVREGADQIGRLDTATIMSNALLRSRAASTQALNFGAESELQRMRSRSSSGFLSAAGSLLGGASSFADKWARYQTPTGGL